MVQPIWRTVWRYLRKVYLELPHDLAIPLLGIYLDKSFLEKHTCTSMFIAALFTIVKTWNQPKCPLTDDWIRKRWYISTMKYYSAIKKNEIMPFAATWMELKTLILSVISQKEKDKYHMISLIFGIQYTAQMNLSTEKKIMDLENRLVVPRAGVGGLRREGWTGNLGLTDADSCLWNGFAMRLCCVALGTLLSGHL